MTAALQRNKLRLSIGSERAQPGIILSVVDDSRTWALFSVKPGWFICAIFGGQGLDLRHWLAFPLHRYPAPGSPTRCLNLTQRNLPKQGIDHTVPSSSLSVPNVYRIGLNSLGIHLPPLWYLS